jgi:spoIIIJ-associated protein
MIEEIISEGPTVEDAVDVALEELGVQQDAIEFEVLSQPTASAPARVRVVLRPEAIETMDDDEEDAEGDDAVNVRRPAEDEDEALTDEELDAIADAGSETIKQVLELLGIEGEVEEYEGDEGELILDIVGDDLGLLIGRHGRTLDALQVLVSAITNRRLDKRYPLVVDVSGYRHRRRIKLEDIARRAAERASRQHRAVQLRPMTSFERRVIHMILRDDRRVSTESEGEEPRRMVVVRPR